MIRSPHPSVHFGPVVTDLRPIVREAIDALGYFRADRADQLADLFVRLWPAGISSTMLIYNDLESMTDEEKRAAGAGRARMPRDVWAAMSEKGRAAPARGIQETTVRIILAVQRARRGGDQV